MSGRSDTPGMDGLSKEERRRRALEMLKAKPRPAARARAKAVTPEPAPDTTRRGASPDSGQGRDETSDQADRAEQPAEPGQARKTRKADKAPRDAAIDRARTPAPKKRPDETSGGGAEIEALRRELEERARELEERARELEARERSLAATPTPPPVDARPADTEKRAKAPLVERVKERAQPAPRQKAAAPASGPEAPTAERPTTRRDAGREVRRDESRDETVEALALDTGEVRATQPPTRSAPAGTLLDVTTMDVHYGKIQALRGINMTIQRGEVIALLGANGAGKSSTLRAISGMVTPSAGDIVFEGTSIAGLKAHQVVKYGIAHVPEGRELFPQLTVEENLRFGFWPLRKTGPKFSDALDRVYSMFPRLRERRSQAAGTMSGGEQQMLVFGRALMSSPKLLLVDEMSLGLAPLIVQILFDAIKTINADGASVVIVEQFVHLALKNSHRAYVLTKGEVVLESKSALLENDPNLLSAYLGGAEGHVEEVAPPSALRAASAKTPLKRPPARAGARRSGAKPGPSTTTPTRKGRPKGEK